MGIRCSDCKHLKTEKDDPGDMSIRCLKGKFDGVDVPADLNELFECPDFKWKFRLIKPQAYHVEKYKNVYYFGVLFYVPESIRYIGLYGDGVYGFTDKPKFEANYGYVKDSGNTGLALGWVDSFVGDVAESLREVS